MDRSKAQEEAYISVYLWSITMATGIIIRYCHLELVGCMRAWAT